ncbi:ribonuclease H-like domain, reverse transcriptase, RNA-dependent DNA polymerase [Tanacetum coccineum]
MATCDDWEELEWKKFYSMGDIGVCRIQVSDGLGPQKKLIFLSNMQGNPQMDLQDQGVIDSGCSRHMTGNMSYLTDYEDIDEGYVAFGGNLKGRKITGRASTNEVNATDAKTSIELSLDLNMPELEGYSIFKDDEDVSNMGFVSTIQTKNNHKDSSKLLECLLLSQKETQKVIHSALKYPILDKRLSRKAFINQITRSWTSGVTRLKAHKALKGSFRNKKMKDNCYLKLKQDWISRYTTRRKDRLIMKDFAPVARIEAIRLFLAYASFKDFVVYQMDVSAFIYGKIKKEVYVCQPPGFEDPNLPDRTASTSMETQKLLLKNEDGEEVDVHLYRSMIGSLMYLTSSRPDIMFTVCACARYQVNPKVSHIHAVKRIFRYLKGQPKLSLWYLKDSPFDMVAYTDSDYAGASLDRKSTTGDEVVNEEMDDTFVRAATTASSLEAEQDSGNILKTRSKATPNEPSSLGTSLGGGPRRQETIRDIIARLGEFKATFRIPPNLDDGNPTTL